jgi:hypothetical protein
MYALLMTMALAAPAAEHVSSGAEIASLVARIRASYDSESWGAIAALAQLGPRAVPALVGVLREPVVEHRLPSALCLSGRPDTRPTEAPRAVRLPSGEMGYVVSAGRLPVYEPAPCTRAQLEERVAAGRVIWFTDDRAEMSLMELGLTESSPVHLQAVVRLEQGAGGWRVASFHVPPQL